MENTTGVYFTKNTIMFGGKIQNFSMASSADNFSIRKYTPATKGGATISAKFAENASVSGNAILTLEQGAEVEVVDNATLSFGTESTLLVNTDRDGSTSLSIASGAGISFENEATLFVNIIDENSAVNTDGFTFAIMNWNDDSRINGLYDFVLDKTIFLYLNGVAFTKEWNYIVKDNSLIITAVPEPATYAAVFGALALALAVARRRR